MLRKDMPLLMLPQGNYFSAEKNVIAARNSSFRRQERSIDARPRWLTPRLDRIDGISVQVSR